MQLREDLYRQDNFYFGFDSSNNSYLNLINSYRPLAVKYGSVFMIYNHSATETAFDLFWIDNQHKQLVSLIQITTKPEDSHLMSTVLPCSFDRPYRRHFDRLHQAADEVDNLLALWMERLTKGVWPNEEEYEQLIEYLALSQGDLNKGSAITCANLPVLQQQLQNRKSTPDTDDFVTPYSLIDGNPDLDIDELLSRNPTTITIRKINDEYPRIEVIIPDEGQEERYMAIYKTKDPDLFVQLEEGLGDSKKLSSLLKEQFPERIGKYFSQQGIQSLAKLAI